VFELVLRAPAGVVEPVSDLLMDEAEALSVSVEDADAGSEAEQALFGEPGMPPPAAGWERSTLKALFDTEAAAEQAAALVLAHHGDDGVHLQSLQVMAEQDWVRLTQSQFAPVAVTDDFWVVPSWHEVPAAARHVIRLDPGLAFGTGTHPTTRMCLRWLATRPADTRLDRVLDYGCGSGILAIGAALMGAPAIDAVDIDAAAVTSTRENASRNGVTLSPGLPDRAQGAYTVVLANILATPLKLLAPLLAGHVAPGGWLVMAGILERQADELSAAYAPWLDVRVADREDGWILMTARRPAGA
jgi:ribosomal protein L11 methyltransferase